MEGSLRELRERLRAARKVLQVTEALERVSSVRLLRSRGLLAAQEPYAARLAGVVAGVARAVGSAQHPLLRPPPADARQGLLVFGGDRGLCGAFNTLLVERGERFAAAAGRKRAGLMIVGKVVRDRLRRLGWEADEFLAQPRAAASDGFLTTLAQWVSAGFRSGHYGSVSLLYVHTRAAGGTHAELAPLLPLTGAATAGSRACLYEPEPDALLRGLMPEYVRALVRQAWLRSLASEHAARHASMSRATDNARKMIGELTLQHNRLRQDGITTEMMELAAGMEG